MVAKSYKGLDSDDEESEEEVPTVKLDQVEYNFIKTKRDKQKSIIQSWVRNFKVEYKRSPTDSDTSAIAVELKDYINAEVDFLEFKHKMLEAKLLTFSADEF